jgi:crotonobetainyl-CoA:carnitine CoA-transferase CaiB-like acyl-CoA transferase
MIDCRSVEIFRGLRVVDMTTGMAGPLASMLLADHGADVVKVEPVGGEWARALHAFSFWNRGKRSLEIDLDDEAHRSRLAAVVAGADVLLATDAAGVLGRIGKVENPAERSRLITCSISGFGPAADHSGDRPYEAIVAARTGRMSELDALSGAPPGLPRTGPIFTAAPVASFGASQLAVHGIVASLLQRQRTGVGQHVETSLLEGAVAFVMRQELGRSGDSVAGISEVAQRGIELCFLTAECADGRYIQMCARQDRHFYNWLRATGLTSVLDEDRFRGAPLGIATLEDVEELEGLLAAAMRTRTLIEWMHVFANEFDVGADPFLTPEEFLAHPDMVDNGRVVELSDAALGRTIQLGPLVAMADTPASIRSGAPLLGSANRQITDLWPDPPLPLPDPIEDPEDRLPPLAGTLIIEVAYFIAGPGATSLLAELGARVIKVEPLDGDPYRRTGLQSAKFLHGKESLTLDLKQEAGQSALAGLIERADAVVHGFRSSAAARLGLSAETVLARNPRVVHLYAASYGSKGPQSDRSAFHSTPNALSGGGLKQAGRGNAPVNDSYADPGSALGAATALLFGLWARELTGRGQAMETTMLVSTGYIHSSDLVLANGETSSVIADERQQGLAARYRLYACSEGHVFVAAVQDSEWQAFLSCLEIDEPEATDAFTAGEEIASVLATAPAGYWVERLRADGVGVAEVFPQGFDIWLERAGLLEPVSHWLFGDYWRLPPKLSWSGSAPVQGSACAPGEHSSALLLELGFAAYDLDVMRRDGVTSDSAARNL